MPNNHTPFVSIAKCEELGLISDRYSTISFEAAEGGLIRAALKKAHGNVAGAAKILGTEESAVWDKMAEYAIEG